MTKLLLRCSAVLVCLVTGEASGATVSWHGVHGNEYMLVDSTKVSIGFDDTLSISGSAEIIGQFHRISGLDTSVQVHEFSIYRLLEQPGYSAFVDSLRQTEGINFAEPCYRLLGGSLVLTSNGVIVQIDSSYSLQELERDLVPMDAVVSRRSFSTLNVYSVQYNRGGSRGALDLANALIEIPGIKVAHPDFYLQIIPDSYRCFDYYGQSQYQILRVIGYPYDSTAWDFAGSNDSTIVAVFDDGFNTHEDLPDVRLLRGHDFSDGDTLVAPRTKVNHGMACAGIIAAQHALDSVAGGSPNSGIISLDPNLKILPIKLVDNYGLFVSTDSIIAALNWAASSGAQVFSNSWSYSVDQPNIPALDNVIYYISHYSGPNGIGIPIIWSAGNAGEYWLGVKYPARATGVLAVGAVDVNDSIWYYSNWDSLQHIGVVAPSGDINSDGDLWALDQMGSSGVNPDIKNVLQDCSPISSDQDYDCRFGGTSAAAPVVAGVCALLLSKEPYLLATDSWNGRDVYNIVKSSAQPNLAWGQISVPDYQYGYGRVDAFRALLSISRGDVDNTGEGPDIGDLTALVGYLYLDWPAPFPSVLLGDCNCDGAVDIEDLTVLINYFYNFEGEIVNPCFVF